MIGGHMAIFGRLLPRPVVLSPALASHPEAATIRSALTAAREAASAGDTVALLASAPISDKMIRARLAAAEGLRALALGRGKPRDLGTAVVIARDLARPVVQNPHRLLAAGVQAAAERVPLGPPRRNDSGDFSGRPSPLTSGFIYNGIRRILGGPEQRALAWEEFAVLLNRYGWRMSDDAYAVAWQIRQKAGLAPPARGEEVLFESSHFKVVVPKNLLVDRKDGGHLIIYPLVQREDIMHFTPEETREFIPFCRAVGCAFHEVMNESGIAMERINWMDMGNWKLLTGQKPRFHLHVVGRARNSRFQIHGEFMQIPPKGSKHYQMIQPLNPGEVARLREKIPVYFSKEIEPI